MFSLWLGLRDTPHPKGLLHLPPAPAGAPAVLRGTSAIVGVEGTFGFSSAVTALKFFIKNLIKFNY